MNDKSKAEAERRAKLLKSRAERLPDIKKQFEENQKRNFNANFAPGGKDEKLVRGKHAATLWFLLKQGKIRITENRILRAGDEEENENG